MRIWGVPPEKEDLAQENLVAGPIQEKPALFLTPLHRSERGIAEHIDRLVGETSWGYIDTAKVIPWVTEREPEPVRVSTQGRQRQGHGDHRRTGCRQNDSR